MSVKHWPILSFQNLTVSRRMRTHHLLQNHEVLLVHSFWQLFYLKPHSFTSTNRGPRSSAWPRWRPESEGRRSLYKVSKCLVHASYLLLIIVRVGHLLQKGKYKSGPLPKAFKIIPSLPAWARILALTHPENWSPQATRAATRIFISNMKPPQARVFLQGVVLDAVREDIRENGKLNVHYYEALKRSLYKPAAFFKGIVFPLLDVNVKFFF